MCCGLVQRGCVRRQTGGERQRQNLFGAFGEYGFDPQPVLGEVPSIHVDGKFAGGGPVGRPQDGLGDGHRLELRGLQHRRHESLRLPGTDDGRSIIAGNDVEEVQSIGNVCVRKRQKTAGETPAVAAFFNF